MDQIVWGMVGMINIECLKDPEGNLWAIAGLPMAVQSMYIGRD